MSGTSPPGVEVLQYTYTTRAEIESILSEVGVYLRLEDKPSSQTPGVLIEDVIDDATDYINDYCIWRYRAEDMANSRWVRRRASWVACHLLSERRGNAAQFTDRFDTVTAELEEVKAGRSHIPRIGTTNQSHVPHYDNLILDWKGTWWRGNIGRSGTPVRRIPEFGNKWP